MAGQYPRFIKYWYVIGGGMNLRQFWLLEPLKVGHMHAHRGFLLIIL